MSEAEIRARVLASLLRVAPETDVSTIRPDLPLREQIDIDSIDFLNFVIELHHDLHVDVPEADYDKLVTLDSAVTYLGQRVGAA